MFYTPAPTLLSRLVCSLIVLATIVAHSSPAKADNGTVVTGTVTGIDGVNQIMRVWVTAVNGQFLPGNPQTNYVDYLVTPNTIVYNANNQVVDAANVLVGSRIQMQFSGPLATTITLVGGGGFLNNNFNNTAYVNTPSNIYHTSQYTSFYSTPTHHHSNNLPNHIHIYGQNSQQPHNHSQHNHSQHNHSQQQHHPHQPHHNTSNQTYTPFPHGTPIQYPHSHPSHPHAGHHPTRL